MQEYSTCNKSWDKLSYFIINYKTKTKNITLHAKLNKNPISKTLLSRIENENIVGPLI
jgi:hypothetical protein